MNPQKGTCGSRSPGDIAELQSLLEAGYDVNAGQLPSAHVMSSSCPEFPEGDYDRRTAIHIAAAEGRDEAKWSEAERRERHHKPAVRNSSQHHSHMWRGRCIPAVA